MNKRKIQIIIGSKIRNLRVERGWTQESFAQKADLDRSYYGGIERGERNISSINLVKIAIALNKDVGDLFPSLEDLNELL